MVPGPSAWLVVSVVPLRPPTQPEGSPLSNGDLGEHLRLQPVVDPCRQKSIQNGTNKFIKYCTHRYVEKEHTRVVKFSNPGPRVSSTDEIGRGSRDRLVGAEQEATTSRSVLL